MKNRTPAIWAVYIAFTYTITQAHSAYDQRFPPLPFVHSFPYFVMASVNEAVRTSAGMSAVTYCKIHNGYLRITFLFLITWPIMVLAVMNFGYIGKGGRQGGNMEVQPRRLWLPANMQPLAVSG